MDRSAGTLTLALRVLGALTLARVSLRWAPPLRTVRWMLAVRPRRAHRPLDPARVIALTHGVGRRLPWRPTCLERALAAGRLLGAASVEGRVVVGVACADALTLDAHAWVETSGLPAHAGRHAPLVAWRFPATASR